MNTIILLRLQTLYMLWRVNQTSWVTVSLLQHRPEFRMLLVEVSALPSGPVSHLQHLHYNLIPLPPALP